MEVVKSFGHFVDKWSEENPRRARRLLAAGWEAQDLKFRLLPEKQLNPSDQYLAHVMMRTALHPLEHPEDSAIVSVFTPCELLQETGLYPYNVESFSCYLAASQAERAFLQSAEDSGLSETLCSYHKVFIGAAQTGILPKPRCIVYTNLACDANLLTFRRLAQLYQVPSFAIDVPMKQTPDNVAYVADQLRDLSAFLEKYTRRQVDMESLRQRVKRSRASLDHYTQYQQKRADRYIPTDLITPLYSGMTGNLLLGTEEEEKYTRMLLEDVEKAPKARGTRIYWMHTIPYWSNSVRKELQFNENAQIVGCELTQLYDEMPDYDDPYDAMAARLVYNSLNGPISRRIQAGIRHAREAKADGAVWFCHWGCKHTLGGAQLAKKEFEKQGIPLLILDGDGCDKSHGGEGQTATRLGAFLEMLGGEGA